MRQRERGFNIIELLVTLVVIAVVVAIGGPSLASMVQDMRMSASTNNLLTFFNYARSESTKRSARVTICVSSDQATCTVGADWAVGAIAFVDSDGNNQVNGGETVLRVLDPVSGGVTITATAPFTTGSFFYYRPSGASNSSGTLRVCRSGRKARDVSINTVGRPMSQATATVCA